MLHPKRYKRICCFVAVAHGALWGFPPVGLAQVSGSQDAASKPTSKSDGGSNDGVPDELAEMLRSGKLEEAVARVQEEWQASPDDVAVTERFLQLHGALLDRLLREDRLSGAERVAQAMLRVSPKDRYARRVVADIEAARRRLPEYQSEARAMLEAELFEPAYRMFKQVAELDPAGGSGMTDELLTAVEGSGDDHYVCKNFHRAFFYYDMLLKSGRPPSESLRERWMQSMVFSLEEGIDPTNMNIEQWHKIIADARDQSNDQREVMLHFVRAMAAEDLGQEDQARTLYRAMIGGQAAAGLPAYRGQALDVIRGRYNKRLVTRRSGWWTERGSANARSSARFTIVHENARAAEVVERVLNRHFERICRYLGKEPRDVKWAMPCDVTLYLDQRKFRDATGSGGGTTAVSRIVTRGGTLERHEIHAVMSDPLLLSSSLPHELFHLILGAVTEYRAVPGLISEGLALHVEPSCRQIQFQRVMLKYGGVRSLSELLRAENPHESPDPRFYAEAYEVVDACIAGAGAAELVAGLQRGNAATVIPKMLGVDGLDNADRLINARLRRPVAASADRAQKPAASGARRSNR